VSDRLLAHDDVGEGPALVLLHGHPFDRRMWAPQLRSGEAVVAELVAALPDPDVVRLPGTGHLPNLEAPADFDAAVRRFASGR
jgi:pimeloyl-ACP methyl ester carboxylesterase